MKKPKKEEKPLSGAQEAYEWLQILIVALVTIILVFTFVGRITPVVGESMLPTLHEGDVMLIRDIGYTDPQPGDIVVLTKEFDAARGPIVKRIIAVEADAAQARTCYQKAIDLGFDAKEELEELDKAAPAGAAEQPKKKKSFLGRLFGK